MKVQFLEEKHSLQKKCGNIYSKANISLIKIEIYAHHTKLKSNNIYTTGKLVNWWNIEDDKLS